MPLLPSLPKDATLLNLFRAYPTPSKPLIEFHEVLLRGPSPFTEAERELIATYVSGLNHCRYCRGVHSATTELLGIPLSAIDSAIDDLDAAPIDEKMKPVLRYARKLTQKPTSVTEADAYAIFVAGWDETALFHTVAITALFNFMNRLVEGVGIELQPAYVKGAAERLAKRGYLPLIAMIQSAAPPRAHATP
jgi:uncharacterized peroxidase-related enzyme